MSFILDSSFIMMVDELIRKLSEMNFNISKNLLLGPLKEGWLLLSFTFLYSYQHYLSVYLKILIFLYFLKINKIRVFMYGIFIKILRIVSIIIYFLFYFLHIIR